MCEREREGGEREGRGREGGRGVEGEEEEERRNNNNKKKKRTKLTKTAYFKSIGNRCVCVRWGGGTNHTSRAHHFQLELEGESAGRS